MKNLDSIIRQQNPSVVTIRNFNKFKDIDGNDVVVDMEMAQAEYDANQYQRDRQYPSIGDQLDMQYHDQLDGTTTWKDAIAKVKSDNPKE